MSRTLLGVATLVALVVIVVLGSVVYVVDETEQVVITQFGRPVGEAKREAGLKLKVPFIQRVNRFDKRFLEWVGDSNELPTRDRRFIWVDTYARWQITDPLPFYESLEDEPTAQSRLDDILDGVTRDAIASHDLVELVRISNRQPEFVEDLPEDESEFEQIRFGRDKIRQDILDAARVIVADARLGIEILDVQFKRIDYVEEVRERVYDRMIAERRRIAARFRSEGEGQANRILGERERELRNIRSEAFREAEEIQGLGDAEAAAVYAGVYNRSAASREFYTLMKTLETLPAAIDDETTVVLSTSGELYRYLAGASR